MSDEFAAREKGKVISKYKYRLLHACCDQPVQLQPNDEVAVYSGCDGSVVFRGSYDEFVAQFATHFVWQFDEPSAPGFYDPVPLTDIA